MYWRDKPADTTTSLPYSLEISELAKNVYFYYMERRSHKMLENLRSLHELGRQRCFELGNPFYFQDAEDINEPGNEKGNFYRKELNTGELYLVLLEVNEGKDQLYSFKDKVIKRIK
jgi:hypothetical protein